jgi:chemotaxis signal transduction protein
MSHLHQKWFYSVPRAPERIANDLHTAGIDSDYIAGVVNVKDTMVILLYVDHLLSARELEALSKTTSDEDDS